MVYDRGKSHSSPSYSSRSHDYSREKTPEEKQKEAQERKEREQQREFEQQVKTAVKSPPTQVKELTSKKVATERELWFSFLDNLSNQFNSEVVAIVASTVSDSTISFDKLIAAGIDLDIAIEVYKNWNSLWGVTINQIATTSESKKQNHQLTTDSEIEGKQTDNKSLKASEAIKEPTQQQQQSYREDSYEVAFLTIPVVVIGGFVLVAAGATLLLQTKDENGEWVTVNEYASRPIAELLEAITNDIRDRYQTEAKDRIAEIKTSVSTALEKIVVTEEPENQVYTTPDGERGTIEHTGSVPPEVETGTPGFDTEAGREVETQQHTGHEVSREVDWDNYIFESSTKKPWRGDFVLNDGTLRRGWIHIDARHITGNHPKGAGDLFEPNTTRAEIETLAKEVVKNGTRTSEPDETVQTFDYKTKFQGKREWFKAVIDTATEELVTIFPMRQ